MSVPFTHWNAQKLEDNPAWVKPLIQDPRQSRWAGSFDRNWPWCSISWGCLYRRHAMASAVNIQQYSDQYVLLNKKHSTRIISNYSLTIVYILVRLRTSSFHLILTTIRVRPWGQRRAILPCKACQIPGNEVSEFHDAWEPVWSPPKPCEAMLGNDENTLQITEKFPHVPTTLGLAGPISATATVTSLLEPADLIYIDSHLQ